MLKNYDTASTGLQGVPYVYYHFGSHWFFAQISKLTDFHLVRVYTIFYPFVIIPCFFKAFLTFGLDTRRALRAKSNFSFVSLAFMFCVFLGIPNHWYSQGFFDASILGLESMTFSLLLMFILGSIWIALYLRKNNRLSDLNQSEKILIMVISPVIFWSIGLVKISTLFVILGIFFILIIRFRRWNDIVGGSFYITLIGSCAVYFFVAETIPFGIRTLGQEGDLKFGSVYASMAAHKIFNPVDWFVMFFLWTYLTIVIVLFFKVKSSWAEDLDQTGLSTIMLVSIVASLLGLLPSFLFSFNGGNAIFFVAIQMYISGSFLIALGPTIQGIITRNRFLLVSFVICSVLLLVLIHKKTKFKTKEVLLENLNTRILIANENPTQKIRFSLNHDLELIWNGFSDLQARINSNKIYQILVEAEKLGNHSDPLRSKTLLFIEDYVNGEPIEGTENLNCLEKSFLIPALSGYAVLNGAIYNCSIESYGEAYYNYPGQFQDPSAVVICDSAIVKGFTRIVSYKVADNSLRPLDCTQQMPAHLDND